MIFYTPFPYLLTCLYLKNFFLYHEMIIRNDAESVTSQ